MFSCRVMVLDVWVEFWKKKGVVFMVSLLCRVSMLSVGEYFLVLVTYLQMGVLKVGFWR
jgi:hypothetical protein